MKINGQSWRTIWFEESDDSVGVIDQTQLPHRFKTKKLFSCKDAADAISTMVVRGAPLIGVTGAYGLMLALKDDSSDESLMDAFDQLIATRPTAVNLCWALERVNNLVKRLPTSQRFLAAKREADLIANEDISMCEAIGNHGCNLLQKIAEERSSDSRNLPLNILITPSAG